MGEESTLPRQKRAGKMNYDGRSDYGFVYNIFI